LSSPPGSSAHRAKSSDDLDPGDKGGQAEKMPQTQERQLFDHPYAVLAEIAGDVGTKQNLSDAGEGGAQKAGAATGSQKGDAYRDPFDPNFWKSNIERQLFPLPDNAPAQATTNAPQKTAAAAPKAARKAKQSKKDETAAKRSEATAAGSGTLTDAKTAEAKTAGAKAVAAGAAAKQEADRLTKEIARLNAKDHSGSMPAPNITAVRKKGGVLISVTDNLDYGMFAIGSARPDKRVVVAIASIAKLLEKRKGQVVVSGHTDARPFKSDNYDNWRLSTARAQMAYYMLVRGGLDPARVLKVEGYADREPKNPSDPNAAENRRIEIFLKTPG
jgi:chemotaxis protein MotB